MILKRLILALILALPLQAFAEEDGEELLAYMQKPATAEVALAYVDDVRKEWDGTLFCMPEGNRSELAFDAVKQYLEGHAEQRYRPRRYLIIQGLRGAYPCSAK